MGSATVRLQRRMGASLQGRRIVVTRAREQAGDLVRSLEACGAVTVIAPVIRIQPLENLGGLRAALTGLSTYRWVVFTSQNAVQIVFDRLVAWGLTPRVFSTTSVAAIGTATAEALTLRGVVPALVPEEFVAESLADALIRANGGVGTIAGTRPWRRRRAHRGLSDRTRAERSQRPGGRHQRRPRRCGHVHLVVHRAVLC